MKKQILALMACASFLAPTPGFCMESNKDKPNGPLVTLKMTYDNGHSQAPVIIDTSLFCFADSNSMIPLGSFRLEAEKYHRKSVNYTISLPLFQEEVQFFAKTAVSKENVPFQETRENLKERLNSLKLSVEGKYNFKRPLTDEQEMNCFLEVTNSKEYLDLEKLQDNLSENYWPMKQDDLAPFISFREFIGLRNKKMPSYLTFKPETIKKAEISDGSTFAFSFTTMTPSGNSKRPFDVLHRVDHIPAEPQSQSTNLLNPVSDLCMKNEEKEQKDFLNILPRDFHLEILDNLSEATDVVSLKRVSQYFCQLAKETKEIIPVEINSLNESRHASYYKKPEHTSLALFLAEQYDNPLISLGHFDMVFQTNSLAKKIVTLPKRVQKGTLLAQHKNVDSFGCASRVPECFYKSSSNEIFAQFLDKNNVSQKELLNNSKIYLQIILLDHVGFTPTGPMFTPAIRYSIEDPQPDQK